MKNLQDEKINNFSKILPLLIILFSLAGLFLLIDENIWTDFQLKNSNIKSIREDIAAKLQGIKNLQDQTEGIVKQRGVLRRKFDNLSDNEMAKLNTAALLKQNIPSSNNNVTSGSNVDIPSTYVYLEQLGGTKGLFVKKIDFSDFQNNGKQKNVTISLVGTYENFEGYLNALQGDAKRRVSITDFKMESIGSQSDLYNIELKIII